MTALLTAEGLELAYGQVPACRDITFHVEEGEVVTLVGANGAGKSTTLRAVAGALIPRAGVIRFQGRVITRLRSDERTNLGIALVPEGRHVFPYLTVRENLELGGFKFRKESAKVRSLIEKMFAMFPRLSARASQNAGTLSGGEQQMLVLGRAMMSEPRLLCLDEPSLGLAPMIVQDIFRTIRTHRQRIGREKVNLFEREIGLGANRHVHAALAHVSDDADDDVPGRFRFEETALEPTAERVFPRPIRARHRLVDDCHFQSVGPVASIQLSIANTSGCTITSGVARTTS